MRLVAEMVVGRVACRVLWSRSRGRWSSGVMSALWLYDGHEHSMARAFCRFGSGWKSCCAPSPPPPPLSPPLSQHPPASFCIAVTPLTSPLAPQLIAHIRPNGIDGG